MFARSTFRSSVQARYVIILLGIATICYSAQPALYHSSHSRSSIFTRFSWPSSACLDLGYVVFVT